MKKGLLSFFVFTAGCWLVFNSCLSASSFKILGTRPLGMGGAFVAVAEDAFAPYWNPAALGVQKGFDFQLPLSVGVEATGEVLNSAQKIAKSASDIQKIQDAQQEGKALSLHDIDVFTTAVKNLKELSRPGHGFLADASGGGNIRVGGWALTVNNFSSIGIDPYIDTSFSLGSGTFSGAPAFKSGFFSSGQLNGVTFNMDKLRELANNINISTKTPDGLESESSDLSRTIEILAQNFGVQIDPSLNSQMIANALINIALQQGVSKDEIKNVVRQIKDATPLLSELLSGRAFRENKSNLTISGVSLTEITLSHGRQLPYFKNLPFLDKLYLGVNIKYMLGNVIFWRANLMEGKTVEISDLASPLTKNVRSSANLGLDLGVLWSKEKWPLKPRAGLLARNINSPSFEQPPAAKDAGFGDYRVRSAVSCRGFNKTV